MPGTHVCVSKFIILTTDSGPGDPFPDHSPGGWSNHKQDGGGSGALNTTKIKERQVHHG